MFQKQGLLSNCFSGDYFFKKKKVKRCQEQIFKIYWMLVFISDT